MDGVLKAKSQSGKGWRQGGSRNWQNKNWQTKQRGGQKVGIEHLPEQFNELSRETLSEDCRLSSGR